MQLSQLQSEPKHSETGETKLYYWLSIKQLIQ